MFNFYDCKANLNLKKIYIEHIIFLLKNNINFYNNLETCGCTQGLYRCNSLWDELWQNKIRSNIENIKQNYITDLMLINAANNIVLDENEVNRYLDYFKKNNLLSNNRESFNLISKLFNYVDVDKDNVYKIANFNFFINKLDIKYSLDVKDFEYFSILAENGFIERLYNMSKNDRLDQYTAMRANIFEQFFPNSKNKDIVKNIGGVTQGRYNAYVNEKNEYLRNYLGFGKKNTNSSNSSDNDAKSHELSDYENIKALTYEMTNCKEDNSILDGKYTECKIKYADGKEGYIYKGKMSGKYFFETALMDGHRNEYYKSLESCINAHYVYTKYKKVIEKDRTY